MTRRASAAKWLLLIHRTPARPDYRRVRVRRELARLGAVAIKNSVYVTPADDDLRAALCRLARDIVREGGDALVCEAELVEGLADGAIEDLLRAAAQTGYAGIASEARTLAGEPRGRSGADEGRRRKIGRAHERLRMHFDAIAARDRFGARGRDRAAGMLSLLEDRVQGVDQAGSRVSQTPEPPRGATWVTRSGVMVDRIASAWLIRRFIDAEARFKCVAARGYHPRAGERRFDMAGGEYTHVGDHCTFEVLCERFGLRDSALAAIAEIVHDLDLEDGRYHRPEAAGVDRMIVGLAVAGHDDPTRLAQGGAMFGSLYESFRKRGR